MSELKDRIGEATRTAMKAREKDRVAALRLINAEIKRLEVDERRELADSDIVTVLTRMLKQRQDSLGQFQQAGRDDLAAKEAFEIALVREFLPEPLSAEALSNLIDGAVTETGASSMKDMGQVMARIRDEVSGRADMGEVSRLVKARLGA